MTLLFIAICIVIFKMYFASFLCNYRLDDYIFGIILQNYCFYILKDLIHIIIKVCLLPVSFSFYCNIYDTKHVLGKEWYLIVSLILLNVFHYSFYFIIYQIIL